jgi:hypothetical protein
VAIHEYQRLVVEPPQTSCSKYNLLRPLSVLWSIFNFEVWWHFIELSRWLRLTQKPQSIFIFRPQIFENGSLVKAAKIFSYAFWEAEIS